ncbi:membrane protein YcjF [Photobacterium aphoticum]|uniref:Membrane protein YcjF n=1 Tax=Photobacterium aphoticum TaxID=754436 RepID=A0A090QRG3_9GAMM|nr:membrane protein YcjF [Photobacterium aphoticum]
MNEQYKSKIEFDEPQSGNGAQSGSGTKTHSEAELTSQLQFADKATFLPDTTQEADTDVEAELAQTLASKPKRRSGWLKGLLVGGALMAGWQSVDYVVTAYQGGDWLAMAGV